MKLDKLARKYRKDLEFRLYGKGIVFEHIEDCKKVAVLKKDWLAHFATGINKHDIGANQFMWHVFSYGKIPCLEGNEATTHFHLQNKTKCYILFQHHDDAYYLENATDLTQNDLIDGIDFDSSDLYVVSKKFNWTYVITHESSCGPYYYHKNEDQSIS